MSTTSPFGLLNKCMGPRIHIIMKNNKDVVETLLRFDYFVNILLKHIERPSLISFEIIKKQLF